MIASAVLFDRHIAFGALLCVGSDPVRRLRVIITFLDPLAQQTTLHRIVPLLTALEAEDVTALALDGTRVHVLHLHGVAAVGRGTPAQQAITLDEAVGDELLVLGANAWLGQ